jgi:acyl-CoA thioester hydrolase
MKRKKDRPAALTDRTPVTVRFSDLDPMQVVWHGQYLQYFEDGRESFGRRYGISYQDISGAGFFVPVVDFSIQYRQSLRYGDRAIVETRYIQTAAAKILFDYTIYRRDDRSPVATGSSVQVFIDKQTGELELNNPDFYLAWQERWGILHSGASSASG